MKRRIIAPLALLTTTLLLTATGCGGEQEVSQDPSASDYGTVRIGAGINAETEAVANIYAGVLEQAGYETEVVPTGDTRDDYLDAMLSPDGDPIQITPDYSGNLLLHVTQDGTVNPQEGGAAALNVTGMSSGDILSTLPRVLPEGLGTLNAASAENKDALAVTRVTAAEYGLSTIRDLAEHCGELSFGVPSGFEQRSYGAAGLSSLYDCVPQRFESVDDQEELVDRLTEGGVDVADVYTASAAIPENNLVVLEDPQVNFIAQQVLPVVQADELPASARDAVNSASGRLNTADLVFLNRLMTGDDAVSAADAADFWLREGDG
ncbi:ABC transporter substrate-binding protein [Rothia sp. AR01]|uniref:ABC transporter substrate-binding protein n=1 Tax=Rothia santali TaxID=2949643 RepID=A0A9X2HAW8_9MICC|nr:ABC transporter substrate-binding protein [Rothia santali]MCP3424845.1 ABC transporter substrate-binding protein [Rothia santali]